jgi:pantetheine-phosphate adenylyltransferase
MKACIYPGTFDPITNGHIDVIKRATKIFDKVVVAVAKSESKNPLFKLDKRVKMTEIATKNLSNVSVISFDNLLVEFAKEQGINTIIRGLRAVSDFEYELQIGYANATLWDEIETIYLMPSLKNAFISSSIVRSVLNHNGNVNKLVPNEILNIMKG